jgi:hypothetical protein
MKDEMDGTIAHILVGGQGAEMYTRKPQRNVLVGKPWHRWENNIRTSLRDFKVTN